VNNFNNFAKDLFFPKFCFSCQKEGFYLCPDCWHILDILDHNYCLCETNPQRIFPLKNNLHNSGKCHKCQDNKLSGLYFAVNYRNNKAIEKLIKNFKYQPFAKDLAKTLALILVEHFILTNINTNIIWDKSILIPIPIHIKRQKHRGYNQSEELALQLSQIIKVPVVSDVLFKIKNTQPQAELKKLQRIENIKNAFVVKNKHKLKNKKVFLIDDIYTTGSTMSACADVLKKSGAKQVWGITIAREEFL